MTFGEKIRQTRKASGLSQEELAEKLNVSRQAITKWETDKGIPDIANLMTISNLFGIAMDDFISEEKSAQTAKSRLYESVTEYDIDGKKDFDIKLGSAKSVSIRGGGDEKIKVVLSSDSLQQLRQDFKTKIDDIKNRIDIEVHRAKTVGETDAKENLHIEIVLPNKYLGRTELDAACRNLIVNELECQNLEFGGRCEYCGIENFSGIFEIDCNLDMEIDLGQFKGSVEINQIRATSRVLVGREQDFRTIVKGIGNSVVYRDDGSPAEDFSKPDSENILELCGMKSELVIER
ncbi:MAG: helix-turn-helix domain-containing protein [Treponema sp.]|nr:helix-turn-helix domain-containing protein [Treponema sp.]